MHEGNVVECVYGTSYEQHERAKKKLYAEALADAKANADNSYGLNESPRWYDREFNSYRDAYNFLMKDFGDYGVCGCRYRVYQENKKAVSLLRKKKELTDKAIAMNKDLNAYVEKSNVKNHKSTYVGCPKCGSKLHTDYVPLQKYTQKCPLCGENLFSPTIQARIQKYKDDIGEIYDQVAKLDKEIEVAKQASKYTVMLMLKYEYHC